MGTAKTAMTEAFAANMRETVDYILEVSDYGKDDTWARGKLTNAISSAIRMSKVRGGSVGTPEQTECMKIARILHDAKSWNEAKARLEKAITKYPPEFNLNRFAWISWKPSHFEIPEGIISEENAGQRHGKKNRRRVPKDVVITHYEIPTPPTEAPEALALKALYDEITRLHTELAEYRELFWLQANGNLIQKDGKWYKLSPISTNGASASINS